MHTKEPRAEVSGRYHEIWKNGHWCRTGQDRTCSVMQKRWRRMERSKGAACFRCRSARSYFARLSKNQIARRECVRRPAIQHRVCIALHCAENKLLVKLLGEWLGNANGVNKFSIIHIGKSPKFNRWTRRIVISGHSIHGTMALPLCISSRESKVRLFMKSYNRLYTMFAFAPYRDGEFISCIRCLQSRCSIYKECTL